MKKKLLMLVLFIVISFGFTALEYYPINGYELTGIRRLAYLESVKNEEVKGVKLPAGAYLPLDSIKLNLIGEKGKVLDSFPKADPDLQKAVNNLFSGLNESYSVTILDITEGKPIRYAQRREKYGYQPGSVGKIIVATAFFNELCELYPTDFEKRRELLKKKMITAGSWALYDEHTVPFYDPETKKLLKRTVKATDVFSLYEWLDHMLSVSNNGAASVVWREAVLVHVFKEKYADLTFEEAEEYFKNTDKKELTDLAMKLVNEPIRGLGISEDEWRLGNFFTSGADRQIPGKGGSIGSPLGLMKFMIALERGNVIDENTSLEIKRLMYMTDRRIRYASSPALADAAVYFKSGSLYKCEKEEGYNCGKYMGNVFNYMNSVAIVEHPDGTNYMVCLMSNIKKRNSAGEHLALASRIDKLIRG